MTCPTRTPVTSVMALFGPVGVFTDDDAEISGAQAILQVR